MEEKVHFGLGDNYGDLLTEALRNVAYYNKNMNAAMLQMGQEFPDLDVESAEKILNGEMKFQTENDGIHIVIVNDNWTPPNWNEIVERVTGIANGDEKYFRKVWGFVNQPIEILVELAEEAYDLLDDDKKELHEAYLKMMDELVRIEKSINRYQAGYDREIMNPMFFDDDPEPCINVKGEYNGWVSPRGLFYRCSHYTHDELAGDLDEGGVKALENKGWYRLSNGEWDNFAEKGMNKPTNKQMDFIEKWQKVNEEKNFRINCRSMSYEGFLNYVENANW